MWESAKCKDKSEFKSDYCDAKKTFTPNVYSDTNKMSHQINFYYCAVYSVMSLIKCVLVIMYIRMISTMAAVGKNV